MTINVKSNYVVPVGTFITSSTAYVDLLNNAGGSIISVTITKGAGTNIHIRGGVASNQNATAANLTLGVHDGTADNDIARIRNLNTAHGLAVGEKLFTGLGAGTYTFKLRVKLSAAQQMNFGSSNSAFIVAKEVPDLSINAKAYQALHASSFTTSSLTYVDLLDGAGGSIISVTITKGAGTSLLVEAGCSCIQNASNDTIILGVNDGTSDYEVARNRVFATSHCNMAGAITIAGLAAGTYTLKLRVKTSAGNQVRFNVNSDSASIAVTEIAP